MQDQGQVDPVELKGRESPRMDSCPVALGFQTQEEHVLGEEPDVVAHTALVAAHTA